MLNTLQWAVAIASAALYLYNANSLLTLPHFGFGAMMLGLACAGLAFAIQDLRAWITVIAGGAYVHALFGLMAAAFPGGQFFAALGWMFLCAVTASILVWIWFVQDREPSDPDRLRKALTILVSAEALSGVFGYAAHPALIHAPQILILVIVVLGLAVLRGWLPSRMEKASRAGPAAIENSVSEGPTIEQQS